MSIPLGSQRNADLRQAASSGSNGGPRHGNPDEPTARLVKMQDLAGKTTIRMAERAAEACPDGIRPGRTQARRRRIRSVSQPARDQTRAQGSNQLSSGDGHELAAARSGLGALQSRRGARDACALPGGRLLVPGKPGSVASSRCSGNNRRLEEGEKDVI